MRFILLSIVAILLQNPLSAWWWSSEKPKKAFECPHRCGFMGSPSLLGIEWEFVQCLYDADALQDYIWRNLHSRHYKRYHTPEDVKFIYDRPHDLNSPWFRNISSEKVVLTNRAPGEIDVFCDDEGNNGTLAAFWSVHIVSSTDGAHSGKTFIRELWSNYVCDEVYDDEDFDLECAWETPLLKCHYQFDNYIDFRNACNALEEDLLLEVKDYNRVREYHKSPQFQKNIENRFASIQEKVEHTRINYHNIFQDCAQMHAAPSADYQLALHDLCDEKHMEAIDHLEFLLNKVKAEDLEPHLASRIYQSKGEVELEVALYDEAILSLGKAIERNPENKEAHFQIASAYFEQGNIYEALMHFQTIPMEKRSEKIGQFNSLAAGLIKGISLGCLQSACDFVPSMICSINGLGHGLWALTTQPKETSKQFINACETTIKFLEQHTSLEVVGTLVPELQKLIQEQKTLSSFEQGELVGTVIGRYGIDIFLCTGISKSVKAYRDLKEANAALTFEAMLASPEKKETIVNFSKKWRSETAAECEKLSQANRFSDVTLYRQFRNQNLSELQIRKILHQAGYKTFPRPKGIPQSWKVEISERKGGMAYSPPNNTHIEIRVMPGDPKSKWPSQHRPYVMHKTPAGILDKNGKLVPSASFEAHIPLEEYNYNKLAEISPL